MASLSLWYKSTPQEALEKLAVKQDQGLSASDVTARISEYGRNELKAAKRLNPFKLFFSQFNDALVIVLLIAAAVSFGLGYVEKSGSIKESLLIFAIVVAIAFVGFFNEYKAEKTVEALKKLVGYKARVRRGGQITEVDSTELVPGDIVVLEAGQKISADMRLLLVNELKVNEASLTGESVPVSKQIEPITKDSMLGDQKCMLFGGTFITAGSGEGVVVETAQRTEIGKIAKLVEGVETEATPMQKKLDDLGKKLGYFIAAICAVVFLIVFFLVREGGDQGLAHHLIFAFTAAVALAVAAIPEGLAFVVRISLAMGARRMAGKNALVRKLSAVEALGSTDVICCDKTGTLTKGEMTVRHIFVNGSLGDVSGSGYQATGEIKFKSKTPSLNKLLEIGVLCNDSTLKDGSILGDPTEGCLLVSAGKAKISPAALGKSYPRVGEIPFTSERKMMSTVHKSGSEYMVATKGAVENMLESSSHYLDSNGQAKPLTKQVKDEIIAKNRELAGQALRVLAFGFKMVKQIPKGESATESGLTFVGLQAMMDPPRVEITEVIEKVQNEAGLRVIMITGDYIETAKAVAAEIGIKGEAISGIDLDKMEQAEFTAQVERIGIYARVNPEHKIRIVQALKAKGHQVAMTGDGVNDAPAIKAADIGIAMGITGTDVSKEAADLILLDDQFLTIINAIEEGRGIFENVRKFVNFLISCNIAEVITIVVGIVVFNDLLLTAAQLLFINIVTDGMPAVALGSDPARSNVLSSKPGRFQEAIVSYRVWIEIFIFGGLMSALLTAQYWYNHTHEGRLAAVSAAFTAMVVYEMVRLVDIRTDYKVRWWANPWLSIAIASSLILQLAVLYVPALAKNFEVGPLAGHDWGIMIIGSIALLVIMKLLNPVLDKFTGQREVHI